MATIQAGGIKLNVEDTGGGRPIVFVHEFASDCRGWETKVRYFSRVSLHWLQRSRMSPERRSGRPRVLRLGVLSVNDIAAVMQAVGIERAHIVG